MFSSSISSSPNSHLLDNAKLDEREAEDQRKAESVRTAITYINNEICAKLKGMQPGQQQDADSIVSLVLLHYYTYPNLKTKSYRFWSECLFWVLNND